MKLLQRLAKLNDVYPAYMTFSGKSIYIFQLAVFQDVCSFRKHRCQSSPQVPNLLKLASISFGSWIARQRFSIGFKKTSKQKVTIRCSCNCNLLSRHLPEQQQANIQFTETIICTKTESYFWVFIFFLFWSFTELVCLITDVATVTKKWWSLINTTRAFEHKPLYDVEGLLIITKS